MCNSIMNLILCVNFLPIFATEKFTPSKTFHLLIDKTDFISVPQGAQEFTLYKQTFKSTIGPIENIYLTDNDTSIEWQSGKYLEAITIPPKPLSWRQSIGALPLSVINRLSSYLKKQPSSKSP